MDESRIGGKLEIKFMKEKINGSEKILTYTKESLFYYRTPWQNVSIFRLQVAVVLHLALV